MTSTETISPVKRIIRLLLAALCLSVLLACASHPYARTSGTKAYPNEPVGFRDIGWGTDLKRVSGMKLLYRRDAEAPEDRIILYERRADRLSFGNIPLESIAYSAYVDGRAHRLASVLLTAKDHASCIDLAQDAMLRYGPAHTERFIGSFMEREWIGDRTVVISRCSRIFNDSSTGGLEFESMQYRLELLRRMRINEDRKLRKAGDDR